MREPATIPIPWKQHWRRFRFATLPWLGFGVLTAAALWTWRHQGVQPHTLGEVEAVRVDLAAGNNGILAPLASGPWTVFDVVESNQVVAQLDDRPIRAQLLTLTEELGRLHKELDAAGMKLTVSEADRARVHVTDLERLHLELEQHRLSVLDRQAQHELNRLELQRYSTRVDCLQPMYERKLISDLEMKNEQTLRDEAAKRFAEGAQALHEAEAQQVLAEGRLEQFPGLLAADVAKELAPVAAAAEVQRARIRELDIEIQRLTIRAPFRGLICTIHHWPGENVRVGDPIVTLAADRGRFIVAYVRQEQRLRPEVGMAVDVRSRVGLSQPQSTIVERVGPQVEPIPLHQCRNPKMPEWGLPVRIALPAEFTGRPGELLQVTFKTLAPANGG